MNPYRKEFAGAHRYTVGDEACPVLLVGEDNPYSAAPENALFPYPIGCAGFNFAEKITGFGSSHQLATWRTNLCSPRWSAAAARERALALVVTEGVPWRVIVMLGRKVAGAFAKGLEQMYNPPPEFAPFTKTQMLRLTGHWITFVSLPHPSGRCPAWNDLASAPRARALLAAAAPTWYGDVD
jgi:hypothetical protein